MASIRELRQEIRVLQRRAGQKISRNEAQGIRVRFSEFDPRRDLQRVDRYNARQLNAYKRELQQFNSRQTRFVSGSEGQPIPNQLWLQYKASERQYNRIAQSRMRKYRGISLPESGMTVENYDALMTPTRPRMSQGQAVSRPFIEIKRDDPSRIEGAQGVRALIADMKRRQTPKYRNDAMKAQRYQAKEINTAIGSEELDRAIDNLTDGQFDVLWNYTDYADEASRYYQVKMAATKQGQAFDDDDAMSELKRRVEWASQLDA